MALTAASPDFGLCATSHILMQALDMAETAFTADTRTDSLMSSMTRKRSRQISGSRSRTESRDRPRTMSCRNVTTQSFNFSFHRPTKLKLNMRNGATFDAKMEVTFLKRPSKWRLNNLNLDFFLVVDNTASRRNDLNLTLFTSFNGLYFLHNI